MISWNPRIAILNGSLAGNKGNTAAVLDVLLKALQEKADCHVIELARDQRLGDLAEELQRSDGFVFCTGTYWDSWGSPLQRFLEEVTELEAGPVWLGKPAACLVTMHSVGGKEVLSRLQGVLSTLGCLIPPMSGMVYSLANDLALKGEPSAFHADLWQLQDLEVIAHNLLTAIQGKGQKQEVWKPWPVDSGDARRKWFSF